jgi:hypothetical protein
VKYSPSRIPKDVVFRCLARMPRALRQWLGVGDSGHLDIESKGLNLPALVENTIQSDLRGTPATLDAGAVPVSLGVIVEDEEKLRSVLSRPMKNKAQYRGVTIEAGDAPSSPLFAVTSGRAFLASSRTAIERQIDRWLDRKKEKAKDVVEANLSLYLAPPADKNFHALQALLEWEAHKRALSAAAAWQALYAANAVSPKMKEEERRRVAARLLGFVPVSPDGTGFVFDEALGQVRSERHGSLARPVFHGQPPGDRPYVPSWIRSLRADLRFREDGIHTTLNLDWSLGK